MGALLGVLGGASREGSLWPADIGNAPLRLQCSHQMPPLPPCPCCVRCYRLDGRCAICGLTDGVVMACQQPGGCHNAFHVLCARNIGLYLSEPPCLFSLMHTLWHVLPALPLLLVPRLVQLPHLQSGIALLRPCS